MPKRVSRWRAGILRVLAKWPPTRRYAGRSFSKLCLRSKSGLQVSQKIAGRVVHLDLRYGVDRTIYLHGAADLRGVRAIENVMRLISPRTAWDIGANRGNHAAFMRMYCRRLFCFEPNEQEIGRVRELFEGDAAVEVLPLALSDQRGRKPFWTDAMESGNSTLEIDPQRANSWVKAMRGDDVAEAYGVRDLDFIKLDVEGHETNVLRGLDFTLRTQRPVIIFEVLEARSRRNDIEGVLPPNYELYGNKRGLISGLFMSAYHFCAFKDGRTYMSAIAVPSEKREVLNRLLPAPN